MPASELLSSLLRYLPEYAPIVVMALIDLKYYAINRLTGEQLISLVESLPDEGARREVASEFGDVMLENIHEREAALIKDYMSGEAESLIAHFEKKHYLLNPIR